MDRAARRSSQASPAGRRSRCACRQDAKSAAATASFRAREDAAGHGRLRRSPRQIEHVVASGYKEIVITGVHLGSYGRDLPEASSLGALVRRLATWEADVLFRISSLEPMDCTDEIVDLVDRFAASGSSFPSASSARRRRCAASHERARTRRPRIGDWSSGFTATCRTRRSGPTSSSASLERPPRSSSGASRLLRDLPLTHLHVFPYSDRPGTAASAMPDKVDGATIRERGQRIRAIGQEMASRFRRSQIGTTRRALTVDDGLVGGHGQLPEGAPGSSRSRETSGSESKFEIDVEPVSAAEAPSAARRSSCCRLRR